MSSGQLKRMFQKVVDHSPKSDLEEELDISRIIIPFSKIFKSYKHRDIYSGGEKIPFEEREIEFRMILRQEFSNVLR